MARIFLQNRAVFWEKEWAVVKNSSLASTVLPFYAYKFRASGLECRVRAFLGWPKTLSGQDICELFWAFFSFSKLFSCNSISIYGFYLGVGLLSSKKLLFLDKCQKCKNLSKYEKNMLFSVRIQACEPRCRLWVAASLEKQVRACELSGSSQARCHP